MFGRYRRSAPLLVLLLASAILAGCGQKGPLYIYEPETPREQQVQAEVGELEQDTEAEELGPDTTPSDSGSLIPSPQ